MQLGPCSIGSTKHTKMLSPRKNTWRLLVGLQTASDSRSFWQQQVRCWSLQSVTDTLNVVTNIICSSTYNCCIYLTNKRSMACSFVMQLLPLVEFANYCDLRVTHPGVCRLLGLKLLFHITFIESFVQDYSTDVHKYNSPFCFPLL